MKQSFASHHICIAIKTSSVEINPKWVLLALSGYLLLVCCEWVIGFHPALPISSCIQSQGASLAIRVCRVNALILHQRYLLFFLLCFFISNLLANKLFFFNFIVDLKTFLLVHFVLFFSFCALTKSAFLTNDSLGLLLITTNNSSQLLFVIACAL